MHVCVPSNSKYDHLGNEDSLLNLSFFFCGKLGNVCQIPAPLGRIVVPSLFLVYALLWVVDVLYPSKPALTLTGTKPLGAAGKDQKDEIKPSMNGNDLKLHVDTTGATVCDLSSMFSLK